LVPFSDRATIDSGSIAHRGLELCWVDDAVDAFFLHIQGSGVVELDGGGVMRVGYAAQNGHAYTSIGRVLMDRGELPKEEVSMQSIRAWLGAHPDQAASILHENASYIFFHELTGEGPLGSLGVPLTAGRSLAVDRAFLPLGLPLWLDAEAPVAFGDGTTELRRMVVAQDTGGAIKGPVRGDVFWGHGEEAAEVAGRMKHQGRLWLLLPKGFVPPEELTR
jgi:membrane-bound lytic murein transglycosylase A